MFECVSVEAEEQKSEGKGNRERGQKWSNDGNLRNNSSCQGRSLPKGVPQGIFGCSISIVV